MRMEQKCTSGTVQLHEILVCVPVRKQPLVLISSGSAASM